jgi:outer membrane protein TolC
MSQGLSRHPAVRCPLMPQRWKLGRRWTAAAAFSLLGSIACVHATSAAIGPTPEIRLSLADAVYIGLRTNHAVKSAFIQRTADKFNLRVSDDKFTPVLTVNASIERQRTSGAISTSTNFEPVVTLLTPTGAQIGFTLNTAAVSIVGGPHPSGVGSQLTFLQPLLNGAGIDVNMASVQIGRLSEAINKLTLKATVETTITQIVEAYRALLEAELQLKIARAAIQRAKDLVTINESLIAAGRMARVDIVQSEADLANQEVSEVQAETQRDTARIQLLTLLSLDTRSAVTTSDQLEAKEVKIDEDSVIGTALGTETNYQQQRCSLEIARQNLLLAENDQLWTLNVVGSIAEGPNLPIPRNRQPDLAAGLQLSIPIGDLTRPQAEINARVAVGRAEEQVGSARDQLEQGVRQSAHQVALNWRQLGATSKAVDLARQQLEIEREKLRVGRSSNFEAVSYEASLQSAETSDLVAKISYLNALTDLDLQVGTTIQTWQIELGED